MATSFSGGRSRSPLREPPTMGKQLVNFITCSCKSSAPFFVIYKAWRESNKFDRYDIKKEDIFVVKTIFLENIKK
jgi:hypothetical protein